MISVLCDGMRPAIALPILLVLGSCEAILDQDPQKPELTYSRLQSAGASATELCAAARAARDAWRKVIAEPPELLAPHRKYPETNEAYWSRRVAERCQADQPV